MPLSTPPASTSNIFPRGDLAQRAVKRVFAGIDSLSAGIGGPSPSSYLQPLGDGLRAIHGDAGPGLLVFAPSLTGFSNLSGCTQSAYVTALAWSDPVRAATLNGMGVSTTNGTGVDSLSYGWTSPDARGSAVGNPFTAKRVYFILRDSSSSFKIRSQNLTDADARTMTISAANGYRLGVPQAAVWKQNASDYNSLFMSSITGNVTFIGIELLKDGATGVSISNVGLGGVTAAQWASLDDGMQQLWWRLMRPDVFLLNAGMNDRGTAGPGLYAAYVDTILGRLHASGKTRVVLIRPNDDSGAATNFLADYDQVLKGAAMAWSCGYQDNRGVLGAYAAASAAGLMYDSVHPSGTGNSLLGAAIAARLAL